MAKEFKLKVEGYSIWWLDVTSGEKGYKEVKTDVDALSLALSIGSSKKYVLVLTFLVMLVHWTMKIEYMIAMMKLWVWTNLAGLSC